MLAHQRFVSLVKSNYFLSKFDFLFNVHGLFTVIVMTMKN